MSEYAYSNKLECIVSIDFALSHMGKKLLKYSDKNKESQNFQCPFPNCPAQMSIRGWRVIEEEHRLPQHRSFSIMGRIPHIFGCSVKAGLYQLPDEESNDYNSIDEKDILTKYILQGMDSVKRETIKQKSRVHSLEKTKNHLTHGLLAIVQIILNPETDMTIPQPIRWRNPKNRKVLGITNERSFNEMVINLFKKQYGELAENTMNIYFGYAKFYQKDGFVYAKINTAITSYQGSPFVNCKLVSLEGLKEESKKNENARELMKFMDKNSSLSRAIAMAGYLTKSSNQNSWANKVFFDFIPYSDNLANSFVFLGDSQYTLAKPYFERNKNSF
ncbi:hypothetical protein [Fructobacillus fructosus]|uniref:hypothetical protein n=1 Tax=Fructobacillus fructosus TaxID=1631 RepID=UPI002D9382F9|nr:unnamed protein product [Fructobacillus fructosus]CAK1249511.1 unnamed protein product [Fructobacillus fructosus]CAK1251446.1 unnamed protein product [Fructobacillus fructosus]CAK1251754.1 unnamed protein product [Fructobacillus fructosus]